MVEQNGNNIYSLGIPLNTDKFSRYWGKLENPFTDNTFKFYTISETVARKNLPSIIISYLTEFDNSDQVGLILKLNGSEQHINKIKDFINDVKIILYLLNASCAIIVFLRFSSNLSFSIFDILNILLYN